METVERSVSQKRSSEKWKIIKNLVVLSAGFLFLFKAYSGLSMLQSTMNQEQGIGTLSQAATYAGFCISALLLPKYVIKRLGCKTTIVLSMVSYVPYIAANYYPHWMTLIPSGILVGMAAALLWGSQCTYFNESAVLYSHLIANKHSDISKKNSIAISNALNMDIKSAKCTSNSKKEIKNSKNGENVLDFHENSKEETYYGKNIMSPIITSKDDNVNASSDSKNISFIAVSPNEERSHMTPEKLGNEGMTFDAHTGHLGIGSSNNCKSAKINQNITLIECLKESEDLRISSTKPISDIVESTAARFFGFHGLVFHSAQTWSNLMSYYILQNDNALNATYNQSHLCGAEFCNVETDFNHNLVEPSKEIRYVLTSISVALSLTAAVLVFFFLDQLETNEDPIPFSIDLMKSTYRHMKKKEQIFLIPISFYIGMEQGFYIGDFTKSYIGCAWGTYHVGLVTICYGAASAISSTLSGCLVKYVGRKPVVLFGGLTNVAANIFLLLWKPVASDPVMFFLGAGMWGTLNGTLWSQLRALYGVLFKKEEAAFACFYLWDSLGYCLSFSYSNYICTSVKIYVLLFVSSLGILGYVNTESIFSKQKAKS